MNTKQDVYEEKELHAANGMVVLLLNIVLMVCAIAAVIFGGMLLDQERGIGAVPLICGIVYFCLPCWMLFAGLRVLRPNEAYVLTLFGRYIGTLKGAGIYFVNPFCTAVNPASSGTISAAMEALSEVATSGKGKGTSAHAEMPSKKISLKTMTLNNDKQKINDQLGNPIIIGIAVIWHIENTAKAVFSVDNYREFLSIQCDAALRNTVRMYPYDVSEEGDEKSLRGSSQEIAEVLQEDIQKRVACAGLAIEQARITTLSYAPEIAAAMLQRQQASAIIDARKMIVEGAVSMVQMALDELKENNVVTLDEERRAQMVSNLLVVLCGNKDAQPIVNSGSIY